MSRKRKYIPYNKLLAAALLGYRNERGFHYISYTESTLMTPDQVISKFRPDHYPVPHAHGGPDEHYNIVWRWAPEHDEKTAKIDVPMMAKVKRLQRSYLPSEVVDTLYDLESRPKPKRKIPSRPFPKRKKRA